MGHVYELSPWDGWGKLYSYYLSLLSDKLFPALGFGGKIGDTVSFEFALNGNPSNPYCVGIPGVIQAYHQALTTVQLWGPTNFAPIINHIAGFAAQAAKKQNELVSQYFFVLLE